MKWEFLSIAALNILFITNALGPTDDPYKILGVKKSATVQELRKAYKKLAKEWHPDKNDDPKAANKFVEITEAYELLTDPDRRKLYDSHGKINPEKSQRKHDSHFDDFDPFDDNLNMNHGFRFTAHSFQKLAITARAFENILRPKSFTTPHLILFFSDWCILCTKVEPVWRRAIEELEPIGVALATVNVQQEPSLAKKCGVVALPAMVLLIEGKLYHFRDSFYTIQKIVDFLRSKFPYKLMINVKRENLDVFLEGWHDNRVRALVFQKNEPIRLRYLLMAFYYSERVLFGFVRSGSPDTQDIRKKYKVSPDSDTLLLFNENTARPIASLSMSVIPVQVMKDVIFDNKYLILPRLSSQKVMDSVCPIEWTSKKKRLCVVLVSENTREHDEPRQVMRQFAQEAAYKSERVRFSYIYQEKQSDFLKSLVIGSPEETVLNVVILWRRDANRVKYEWMQERWCFEKSPLEWNKTKEKLHSVISKLLKKDGSLAYEAVVKELTDEHAQGLVGRILSKFFIAADVLRESLSRDHMLTAASVVASIAFVVGGVYAMAYLVRKEEERLSENGYGKMNSKANGSYTPELRLHELRGERYNGMVRLLKPGCRTIVLVLDQESQKTLMPEFHRAVWPYRKNKTLMFGFMYIGRGIEWYKKLLTLSLAEPRDLVINPKNCIGTVLSLNGHRKYFCMYHAKHAENLGSKRTTKPTRGSQPRLVKVGGFMGLEDSSDSESDGQIDLECGTTANNNHTDHQVILQANLLKGLPDWLDRLFEGTTHRYHINYWPDFPTK